MAPSRGLNRDDSGGSLIGADSGASPASCETPEASTNEEGFNNLGEAMESDER